MKFFKVLAKSGHVNPKFYIPINYYAVCDNAKVAAEEVRYRPRVKHDKKHAILSVSEISYEDFRKGCKEFSSDPYNLCKNNRDQRRIYSEIESRLVEEDELGERYIEHERSETVRNRKRAIKYGYDDDEKIFSQSVSIYDYPYIA